MDDSVLFACGGGAAHMLGDSRSRNLPVELVNPREFEESEKKSSIAMGDEQAIRDRLEGVRVVFVFAVLGGFTGEDMLLKVSHIARDAGCKVVSIAGVPMKFEKDRRKRALDALDRVVGSSDRTIVFDMETVKDVTLTEQDPKFDAFFRMSARGTVYATDCLAHLVEGPFFSTFSEGVYTFSYQMDMDPALAVMRAMESSVFPTDAGFARTIVFVSSEFYPDQTDGIFDAVVSMTGITPDIVKRSDKDDTKVAVFLPVDLTRPSPRASHP